VCTEGIPDEYIASDPGQADTDAWVEASASCIAGEFAHMAVDGTFTCEPCSKDTFVSQYTVANNLKVDSGAWVIDNSAHMSATRGKCCANSHHSVCRAMMSEYKSKCQAVTCAVESEEAPAEEVVDASGAGADDEYVPEGEEMREMAR